MWRHCLWCSYWLGLLKSQTISYDTSLAAACASDCAHGCASACASDLAPDCAAACASDCAHDCCCRLCVRISGKFIMKGVPLGRADISTAWKCTACATLAKWMIRTLTMTHVIQDILAVLMIQKWCQGIAQWSHPLNTQYTRRCLCNRDTSNNYWPTARVVMWHDSQWTATAFWLQHLKADKQRLDAGHQYGEVIARLL